MTKQAWLAMFVIGIAILLLFIFDAICGWHLVFDDSFITYRYAKNLASGHGITWNPGMKPTEGYTNFLLVVILAPFIHVGADPLLVTRCLSCLAAIGITALFFRVARRNYGTSVPTSLMIAGLVLLVPQTRALCLLGLETVLYAFMFFLMFLLAVSFYQLPKRSTAAWLGLTTFLTMLLRPEAALLFLVFAVINMGAVVYTKNIHKMKMGLPAIGVLLLLGGAYLIWKVMHFGYILPNPFYLKAAGTAILSQFGVCSVLRFISAYALAGSIYLFYIIYCITQTDKHKPCFNWLFPLGVIVSYSLFFMKVDTLMDASGRFMYPLFPILLYACVPVFAIGMRKMEHWTERHGMLFVIYIIAFIHAFAPIDIIGIYKNMIGLKDKENDNSLMQKEFRIANKLQFFPGIEHTRIAFGDAGVLPYFTGAIWLDTVGLNDSFIARTRDRDSLVSYFFDFKPDLVMLGSNKDNSWTAYGHGPLGNFTTWASDSRWDAYEYAGTCKVDGGYDLQFFIRTSSKDAQALALFIRREIVDGWYIPVPFSIGTKVQTGVLPTWISRIES